MIVLIDGVRYQLVTPENEHLLEKAVQSNYEYIFGPDSFYFGRKNLIRSKAGVASIPDGYVIFFTTKARWAVIEVELASHPLYEHIFTQLSKFKKGIEDSTTRRKLVDILYEIFDEDEVLKAKFKQKIQSGEVYKFISDLISQDPLIVVIIDQKTEELEEAISDIRGKLQVVEFKTFRREGVSGDVNAFVFEPLFKTTKPKVDSMEESDSNKQGTTPKLHTSTSEALYRKKFAKQLKNPNSMALRIHSYVQENGEVKCTVLRTFLANKYGYSPTSGAVGACITVLEQEGYIQIEGRGDNRILRDKNR